MAKGRGRYITARFIGIILILVASLLTALQYPSFQTGLARFAAEKAGEAFNSEINVGAVCFVPFNTLMLKDISLIDKAPYTEDRYGKGWAPADTLLKAESITVVFSLKGLLKKEGFHILRAKVNGGYLHIVSEPDAEYTSNIQRIFRLEKKDEKNLGNLFRADKVNVRSFRFRLNSFLDRPEKPHEAGINYSDMDVTADIVAHGIYMNEGKMGGTVDSFKAEEKGGLKVSEVSGSAVVGGGRALVDDLRIVDEYSNVSMKRFSMTFTADTPFYDCVNTVIFEGLFNPSTVDVRTITYACGALPGNDLCFDISSGHAKGTVNHLNVEKLSFHERVSGLEATVSALLVGTTHIQTSTLVAHVRDAGFDTSGLTAFLNRWSKSNLDLSNLAGSQRLTVNADVRDKLNDMNVSCCVRSGFGSVDAALQFNDLLVRSRPIRMKGTMDTDTLDVGTVLGTEALGKCTMTASIDARLGAPSLSADIDTLGIESLECLGHTYNDINGKLSYADNFVNGHLNCNDESLRLKLRSNIHIGGPGKIGPGKVNIDIPFADLRQLGFYKTEDEARIGGGVSLAMTSGLVGDGESAVYVRDLRMDDGTGWKNLEDIAAGMTVRGRDNDIVLYSGFGNAEFKGEGTIGEFITYLKCGIAAGNLPSLAGERTEELRPARYSLSANLTDPGLIIHAINPELYIAKNTSITMDVDTSGAFKAAVVSPRVALKTNTAKDLSLNLDNSSGAIGCRIKASEIRTGELGVNSLDGTATASEDKISILLGFEGDGRKEIEGKARVDCSLDREPGGKLIMDVNPGGTRFKFENYEWSIPSSRINICGKDIGFSDFRIGYDSSHFIELDGGIGGTHPDTLHLGIKNIELGLVEEVLQKDLGITGNLGGSATLHTPFSDNFGLQANLLCDSLSIGGTEKSTLELKSIWDESDKKMNVALEEKTGGFTPLHMKGSYSPENRKVHVSLGLEKFDLRCCGPFLKGILSELGGHMDGEIRADGPLKELSIRSKGLKLDKTRLRLAFTDVAYTLDGPIEIDDSSIKVDKLDMTDDYGGKAIIKGELTHDHLKNIRLRCGLAAEDLKALDIKEDACEGLYGNLSISGLAGITGPLNDISVNAQVSTSGEGDVHIPLPSSLSATSSDLLTFVKEEKDTDPYEEMLESLKKVEKQVSNLTINANVKVTPDVKAAVEIDKESGHVLTASGRGDVTIDLKPAKDRFTLEGNYEIEKGSYHFEVPGIVSRDFSISNGSSLNFAGALSNASFNINATHNVKTTLSTLLADTTASARRNVVCGINISGKLSKPEIGFSVSVPDLDPTTKSQVETALNTEDKVQKQFMALLLLGMFVPSEQSGVVNGSNMIYSNVSEIMSSQVNNILNKLNIPVDLGFGYQQTTQGSNMFDVAVSTQLFNNRVEVSGTVGNKSTTSQGASRGEVTGDLDIEIKIDPQGQFRGKLFSHSADDHSSYLDNAQRNGAGLTFQKEFDNLKDLITSLFSTKKKKEGLSGEALLEDKKMKVIKIEHEERTH